MHAERNLILKFLVDWQGIYISLVANGTAHGLRQELLPQRRRGRRENLWRRHLWRADRLAYVLYQERHALAASDTRASDAVTQIGAAQLARNRD